MIHDIYKEANSLSEIKKYRLYFRYITSCYSLKYYLVIELPKYETVRKFKTTEHKDYVTEKWKDKIKRILKFKPRKAVVSSSYSLERQETIEVTPLKVEVKNYFTHDPVSFDEFCKNDGYFDAGEDWKDQGYAQRHIRQYPTHGIYHWYSLTLN